MERRTLLERIGVVATTGVLVGCLDDGAGGDEGSPAAGGDDGQGGNGDGDSGGNGTDDSSGTGGNGSDDGSTSNDGGSDGSDDDPDDEGSDGTGGDGATNSSEDENDDSSDGGSDDEGEDGEAEKGETENDGNESVSAEEDSDFSARDGRSSVETTNADCHGDGDADDHAATIEFDEDRLLVTGHLEAPDPCHEAVLEKATVRDSAVEIEIGLESEDGFCTECIGRIEYEARVEIADGVPDDIVVYHVDDGDRIEVATATR